LLRAWSIFIALLAGRDSNRATEQGCYLKTVKTLTLTIPGSFLWFADEVIG
jgi:hypothetical protein